MNADTISPNAQVRREQGHSARRLPPIVGIVLTEAERRRVRCQITMAKFIAQLERLSTEEFNPRGLSMSVQFLPWGTTRFIIKTAATGEVWDMIEIGPDGVSSESGAIKDLHS